MDQAYMLNISFTVIRLPTTGNTPNVYTIDHAFMLVAFEVISPTPRAFPEEVGKGEKGTSGERQ